MSNKMPSDINLSTAEVGKLNTLEAMRRWLIKFVLEFQYIYKSIRNAPAKRIRTDTWDIYEDSSGDLVFKKWDGSAWQDGFKIKGS